MINHARTLLLNISGNAGPGLSFFGEEYIPPTFASMVLEGATKSIHSALFGGYGDRAFINFRARELLTLVHSTELSDYITAFDNRITYWPSNNTDIYANLNTGVTVSQVSGSTAYLKVIGDTRNTRTASKLFHKWIITVIDSNDININMVAPNVTTTSTTYTTSSGISSVIPLTDNLSFFFQTGGTPSWDVTFFAQPTNRINEIITSLETTYSGALTALFGNTTEEPYLTMRNMWTDSQLSTNYRLAAVVVTLIYRLNELYTGQ